MAGTICIFEDINYKNLLPLVYFRPVYDLRCGILSLREKIEYYYQNTSVSLHTRGYLIDYVKQKNPDNPINIISSDKCLFINGRAIVDNDFISQISVEGEDLLFVKGDEIVAARVSGNKLHELKNSLSDVISFSDFNGLLKKEVDVEILHYPWEFIKLNGSEIIKDFNLLTNNKDYSPSYKLYQNAILLNQTQIFIDENSKIYPGVVIDAEEGPVYIGKNVTILPNAVIQGPAFIGDNSIIKIGASLYHNTNVGRVCKVGGEVENSIIHSYSNKQHDGFLGNSYLGSWVNLGAGTNNSDLKNNYGSIKVYINGEDIDSGMQFVGLTMGDHSKSAINTMFNTGTVVGVSSNVYGADFPPRYIPSFSWGGADSLTTYDLDRSIEVAKRVEARRKITMTEVAEKMFRKVFDLTKDERHKRGLPN